MGASERAGGCGVRWRIGANRVLDPLPAVVTQVSSLLKPGGAAEPLYYLVRRVAAVTGRDLRNATRLSRCGHRKARMPYWLAR